MPLPPEIRADAEAALEEFCREHSSDEGTHRLTYEFAANGAMLLRQRPGFMNPDEWQSTPMAKFRYSQARDNWSLYWVDANGRASRVSNVKAEKDIRALLRAVVSDPLGVFWS